MRRWTPPYETSGRITVYDVKTGAPSEAACIQVMLYMALLPSTKRFKGQELAGSILYAGGGGHQNVPRQPSTTRSRGALVRSWTFWDSAILHQGDPA